MVKEYKKVWTLQVGIPVDTRTGQLFTDCLRLSLNAEKKLSKLRLRRWPLGTLIGASDRELDDTLDLDSQLLTREGNQ
jgi:hypothetical protein